MKFITKLITAPALSLEEAVRKAKDAPKPRTLDEILADIDGQKQVKTAAASAPVVKEAEKKEEAPAKVEAAPVAAAAPVAETKVEVKVAMEEKKAAGAGNFGDKKAPPFGKKEEEKKEEGKDDKKDDKKEEEKACEASKAGIKLKVAKSLDFRPWNAEDVVKAWGQHGSLDACVANVKGKASDPKTYCMLLKAASETAKGMMKTATSKKEKKAGVFKKIAKLTDKEKSFLSKYFGKLYGDDYVSALLEDY
jgi:hypothetical protein